MQGVEHRFVEVGGLRIHVAEAGSGEPVVLQHGWPQHWWAWRALIPALAERYHVICPDLRGHGWSDAPRTGYEREELATDLIGVLDALELERVRLVGHDWGGFAGFLACLRRPERFSHFMALAIIHPWPERSGRDPRPLLRAWYQVLLASPFLGQQLTQRLGFVEAALKASRVAGEWTPGELDVFSERFRDARRARATVALYRTWLTRELIPLLGGAYRGRRLTVPTRLLIGAKDGVFKGNSMAGWEEQAEDMQLEWLPGAGHWLPDEVPEVLLDRLERFFSS